MKKIFLLIPFIALVWSCSSDLTDMNVDPKKPTSTRPEFLFTNAQKALVDQMTSTSVNVNVFRLFSQQWTETNYPDESQYNITTRKIPDVHYRVLYRDVLVDFHDARELINAETPFTAAEIANRDNRLAVIDILSCYAYSILVDTFGDVPYSEALDLVGHPQPKYDDAKTIYKSLITKLKTDVSTLKLNATDPNFGTADLIYGGTAASNVKWHQFANSLIVKLAINMSNNPADVAYATTELQAALASGIMLASGDSAKLTYLTTAGNRNPLYADLVTSKRDDFVPAEPFVAAMDAIIPGNAGDPRMTKYFANVPTPVKPTDPPATVIPAGRTFIGGTYGEKNDFKTSSHITATLNSQTYPGTLIDFTELQFLLAEAAERGLIAGGSATAKMYYDAGITASFTDWGVGTAAAAYLLTPNVIYTNTATTWQEKIGTQAWFALYNRGFEAWTSYRRLDFPKLYASNTAKNNGFLTVPVRYTYPGIEQFLNVANYTSASTAIGGDLMTTKIFWDK
jgi:hypothetical protein